MMIDRHPPRGRMFIVALLCITLPANSEGRSTLQSPDYIAAVVDFPSAGNTTTDDPVSIISNNWLRYETLIASAAAQDVDIIVFPECGLTTASLPAQRAALRPFLVNVPDPENRTTPCNFQDVSGANEVLRNLSCAAHRYQLYVVVNLAEEAECAGSEPCPADGVFIYNTNVVFDRNGTLVARYRKFHLFVEPGFDTPPTAPLSYFDTDFGVRFGTFICFDVLFEEPALRLVRDLGITDVVYNAAWFSELPFLTAVQVHAGWAHALNVTVLGSGLNRPYAGNTGSGVYVGTGGILEATMKRQTSTEMIVQTVSKRPAAPPRPSDPPPPTNDTASRELPFPVPPITQSFSGDLRFFQDDFRAYETRLLPSSGKFNFSLCHGDLCCNFEGHTEPSSERSCNETYYYRAGAYNGVRNFAGQLALGIQVCGVFPCFDSENITSCGLIDDARNPSLYFHELDVSGDGFIAQDALQTPSTLQVGSLLPLISAAFHYQLDDADAFGRRTVAIRSTQSLPRDLYAFGIYGRVFSRDHPIISE